MTLNRVYGPYTILGYGPNYVVHVVLKGGYGTIGADWNCGDGGASG